MHDTISVAVPTRHRKHCMETFLTSFLDTTEPKRRPYIFVIHDAPDKTTPGCSINYVRDTIGEHGDSIVLPNKSSLPQLWNYGIIHTPTDWVLICNDDGIFKHGWLEHLEKQIATDRYDQINILHYGGMCIHKRMMLKIGWFDERFRGGGYEDNDWQLRISEAGLKDRVELSMDFVAMEHTSEPFNKWLAVNNTLWITEKWGRPCSDLGLDAPSQAMDWKQPSLRSRKEIDWHPLHTQLYEQKYGIKSAIDSINNSDWSKEIYH
jgi:hypothetical protein